MISISWSECNKYSQTVSLSPCPSDWRASRGSCQTSRQQVPHLLLWDPWNVGTCWVFFSRMCSIQFTHMFLKREAAAMLKLIWTLWSLTTLELSSQLWTIFLCVTLQCLGFIVPRGENLICSQGSNQTNAKYTMTTLNVTITHKKCRPGTGNESSCQVQKFSCTKVQFC